MALILIETAASASANTYASLAEAELYFDKKYYKDNWSSAATASKNIVLVEATRLLDQHYDWQGSKWTEEQALRWPRSSVVDPDFYDVDFDIIPQFLKDATAELALNILSGDRTAESDTRGIKRMKAGPLELEVDKIDETLVIPDSVDEIVKWYGSRLESQASAEVLRI